MPRPFIRIRRLAVVLGLSLALGGCIVAPAPGYGGGYYGGWVGYAPPAPRVEYYGVAPYPGYFWIPGFWGWGGSRYVWTPGRWAAPRPGYRWLPSHWVHAARGWHLAGGRWARR